jgi:UDP-glucose 4-epimerase
MSDDRFILVVGGAGYIGSHINKALWQRGYKTVVFDSLISGYREFVKWGEFVQGDLADRTQISALFEHYPIRAVLHFAAFASVGESMIQPEKYYRNNVVNTLNLLDIMRKFGVASIIFSSTCAIYGNPLEIPLTEGHITAPINPYGQSKLMVERILSDYSRAYDLRYVSLRYFNAAGADVAAEIGESHRPEGHLIPLILDVAQGRRSKVQIFGNDYETPDGSCIRDYIHVHDLAEAHVLALEYLLAGGSSDAFNLGNGLGHSVFEVIAAASAVTQQSIATEIVGRRPGDPAVLVGSSAKIRQRLAWQPRYADLQTIVATAWNWHQKRFPD